MLPLPRHRGILLREGKVAGKNVTGMKSYVEKSWEDSRGKKKRLFSV